MKTDPIPQNLKEHTQQARRERMDAIIAMIEEGNSEWPDKALELLREMSKNPVYSGGVEVKGFSRSIFRAINGASVEGEKLAREFREKYRTDSEFRFPPEGAI